jgi:hypothetical protein
VTLEITLELKQYYNQAQCQYKCSLKLERFHWPDPSQPPLLSPEPQARATPPGPACVTAWGPQIECPRRNRYNCTCIVLPNNNGHVTESNIMRVHHMRLDQCSGCDVHLYALQNKTPLYTVQLVMYISIYTSRCVISVPFMYAIEDGCHC